ncbi:MAG: hypothetical protein V1720_06225 [bacterium]
MPRNPNKKINIIDWLLKSDPSIRWQVLRDLKNANHNEIEKERALISKKGWGKLLLSHQTKDGRWAESLYSRKWISTTYSMLLLKDLGLPSKHTSALKACALLLDKGFYHDHGINYFPSYKYGETCVTGMILSILACFNYTDDRIHLLVSHLLERQMKDGGWNCQLPHGAVHGSFHTTISVLEGLWDYEQLFPDKSSESFNARQSAHEFLLRHQLYRSHRTGEIIDPRMTRFSFPCRWRYDIMRALDYFQSASVDYDSRMDDALNLIKKKMNSDGMWNLQQRHAGRTFFEIEETGKPSRWITMRALRILKKYDPDLYNNLTALSKP